MITYTKRMQSLREQLAERSLDGIYITNLTNIRYLCGFTGSAGQLLILPEKQLFFSDTRYDEQSRKEVKNCEIHMIDKDYYNTFNKLGLFNHDYNMGFEAAYLPVAAFNKLAAEFPKLNLIPTENITELIAAVKDSSEIEALSAAAEITDRVFQEILPELKPGAIERNIAARVSYLFKIHGADGDAYDPIVASGSQSALPHATPGSKKLETGDFVVLDIGAKYGGYCADMTRTVVIGEATERHREIYNLVLESHLAGIRACRAGVKGSDVDHACREVIEKRGYGPQFNHSTGHGVGLEVHTHPRVSKLNNLPLLENYVVTIEPGIYIPGWGGVRIEDDCWVRNNGCTSLNKSPKEMMVLK